jgi:hypothetical protein
MDGAQTYLIITCTRIFGLNELQLRGGSLSKEGFMNNGL